MWGAGGMPPAFTQEDFLVLLGESKWTTSRSFWIFWTLLCCWNYFRNVRHKFNVYTNKMKSMLARFVLRINSQIPLTNPTTLKKILLPTRVQCKVNNKYRIRFFRYVMDYLSIANCCNNVFVFKESECKAQETSLNLYHTYRSITIWLPIRIKSRFPQIVTLT